MNHRLTSNSQCSWDWPSLPASTSQVLVLQVEHHPPLVPRVLESEDTSRILLSNAFPAFSLPTVGRLFYNLIMRLQTCSFVAAYLNQMFHRTTPHQVCALHSRMCSVLFDLKKKCWVCSVESISQRPCGCCFHPPTPPWQKDNLTANQQVSWLVLPPWFCSPWISQMCESGLLWSRCCLILRLTTLPVGLKTPFL